MAQKLRLSFFAYKNGKEINHTSEATNANPGDDYDQKAKDMVAKHFPEAKELQVKKDDDFLVQGGRTIRADSKIDPTMTFVLTISKL